MNRELLFTVSSLTGTIGHQTKLAEGNSKRRKKRCSSEDIIKLCKAVLLDVRNAEWFFLDLKKQMDKIREKKNQKAFKFKCNTTD